MKNNHLRTIKVSIIGQPNVGKSTLINSFVNEKVAITSRKAQTTIKRERGVLRQGDFQIIFYDTPGIMSLKHKISRDKFLTTMNAISESDLLIVILSKESLADISLDMILEKSKSMKMNYIILFNKIDLLKKIEFVNAINKIKKFVDLSKIFSISALKGYGTKEVISYIIKTQKFYNEDTYENIGKNNKNEFIKEVVREKLLRNIHEEVPYNLEISLDKVIFKKDRSESIHLTIYLKKASYKPIILGHNGKNIKKIGIESRKELEKKI